MIEGLFNSGSMPVLERVVQFTSERHRLISHNIANLSTPNFRPADVSPGSFQQALREAVDDRRNASKHNAELELNDTPQMTFTKHDIHLNPEPSNQNLLFHDRNNRSMEHQMKELAENTMTNRLAIELLHSKFNGLETAIRERL